MSIQRPSVSPFIRRFFFVLAACALLAATVTPAVAAQGGGDTPEEVFDTVRTALGAGDVAGILGQIAPSQRKGAALEIFVGASFAIAFNDNAEALEKGLEKLLEKHDLGVLLDDSKQPGLDADEATLQKAGDELFANTDEVAFVKDLFAFIRDNEVMDLKPGDVASKPLEGLAIDGDVATATWGEQPVKFLREGGRWYLDKSFSPAG